MIQKKCLVVLTGDNFRIGGQATRSKGGEDSYKRQKIATDSHIDFFNYIEKKFNIKIEVMINSYKLEDDLDKDFLSWYSDFVKFHFLNESQFESENRLIEDTIQKISKIDTQIYDSILFIRPDLYLKKYFSESFDYDLDKVKYAHIDSGYPCENGMIPYVCHSITFVPKCFFGLLLEKKVWNWHTSAIELSRIIERSKIDFFSNTLHLCCSSLDWNPLYSMVGRYENTEYKTPNVRYFFDTLTVSEENTEEIYQKNSDDRYTSKLGS